MLPWYVLNVKPYIQLLLCVYGIYFAAKYIFQRFIKSQFGFSNADAGAGYTFYPHCLCLVPVLLSITFNISVLFESTSSPQSVAPMYYGP